MVVSRAGGFRARRASRAPDADRAQPPLRAVLDLAGELAAGGVDVVAARLADRRHEAGVDQHLLERDDALARAGAELGCPGTG